MINWHEILGYAPADSLALISYYLSNEQYHQAAHMIELYGTPNVMAPIQSACDKQKDLQNTLRDIQIELIDLITDILKSRCHDTDHRCPMESYTHDTNYSIGGMNADSQSVKPAAHDPVSDHTPVKHPILQNK